jgi:superfamily II DNA or RNA helicase
MEPALAVVSGLGSRVLLADDVGLGKTIQAGLVVSELRKRGAADRVLILTPAGLRDQWASELGDRFGIDAEVIDAHYLRRRGAVIAVGSNPWMTIPVAVTSTDYMKRAEVLPAIAACRWDVLVVDEAHGIVPGSDRHAAVNGLAAATAHVLLLTATPHSGDVRSFNALCDLGKRDDQLMVFRRTRRQVGGLARRRVHRLFVEPSAAERKMHLLLGRLTSAAKAERADSEGNTWLTLALLHKRALSSPYSLARSARRHAANLTRSSDEPDQIPLPLDEAGEVDITDREPTLFGPILRNERLEIQLLSGIADAADTASRRESKLAMLERWLSRLRRRNESVVVFTEYRDTLDHVREALQLDCVCLHGGMTREERRLAVGAFTSGGTRILLATDAAGEGLNLHHHCRIVFNLELPWNPMRLEQRAGRVDRIGQRKTVHVFHLIAGDTGESTILERLKRRISRAQHDIGAPNPLETEQAITRAVLAQPEVGDAVDLNGEPESGDVLAYRLLPPNPRGTLDYHQLVRARVLVHRRGRPGVEDWTDLEPPNCPLVAFPRRRNIRRAFHKSLIVVCRTVLEDIAGRQIASHLTALQLHLRSLCRSPLERSVVEALLEEAQRAVDRDPSLAQWRHESIRDHQAFWSTRLAREAAVAQSLQVRHGRLQPGLFDQRVERARSAAMSRHTEAVDEAQRRVRSATQAGEVRADTRAVLALFC